MVQIKYTQIFINNQFVDSVSGKTFPTINPATEEKIADVQEGDQADIDKAVQAAANAFKLGSPWRELDACARGALLHKLADLIERDQQYLAQLALTDDGKLHEVATYEIFLAAHFLRYAAGWADKIHGKTIPAEGKMLSYTRIEPVGVCGQIIPWNAPMLMLVWKIGPALAAGCTVVVKPAEQTPLTALYTASLIVEAGFPPGVVNIVPGYGPTAGQALVEHELVNKIAFTGSTEVGKLISRIASKSLKRVSLELGGKSPLVVTENCDVAAAAQIANTGCFFHQGQACIAASRTYVHESVYQEFVSHAATLAQKKIVGNPLDRSTTHGPQIDAAQTERILELIESGIREGARLVAGGKRSNQKGYFVEPTVFADVTDGMRIAREEIFGPVQQILKYSTLDKVIQRCNDSKYGLGAGILTNDISQALQFSNAVQAGTVWVNTYLALSASAPFGGHKQSGIGRECGEDGFKEYCEIKTVAIKL